MIFDCIRQGDAEQIRTLLAADPALANSRTPEGASTVLWAVYTRHPELVPLLLTALGLAAFFGHRDAARLLLDAGANPNQASRNALHVTPLHSACSAGHAAVAGLLLQHSADPNAEESNGMTPLHTAAGTGNREIAALLVNASADRARQSHDGRTPAAIARQYGHPEIAIELDQ